MPKAVPKVPEPKTVTFWEDLIKISLSSAMFILEDCAQTQLVQRSHTHIRVHVRGDGCFASAPPGLLPKAPVVLVLEAKLIGVSVVAANHAAPPSMTGWRRSVSRQPAHNRNTEVLASGMILDTCSENARH